jgi:hypothetical protein
MHAGPGRDHSCFSIPQARDVLAYRSMSSRTRAVWLVAVSSVCAGARPALADGVFNYDSEKVTAFFIEAFVLLAAVVLAVIPAWSLAQNQGARER